MRLTRQTASGHEQMHEGVSGGTWGIRELSTDRHWRNPTVEPWLNVHRHASAKSANVNRVTQRDGRNENVVAMFAVIIKPLLTVEVPPESMQTRYIQWHAVAQTNCASCCSLYGIMLTIYMLSVSVCDSPFWLYILFSAALFYLSTIWKRKD